MPPDHVTLVPRMTQWVDWFTLRSTESDGSSSEPMSLLVHPADQ